MGPKLVDYLLYEPEDSGILWIKFNRPERMNALVGTAEEHATVTKVGDYMRAGSLSSQASDAASARALTCDAISPMM
jgi:hypothetical protein